MSTSFHIFATWLFLAAIILVSEPRNSWSSSSSQDDDRGGRGGWRRGGGGRWGGGWNNRRNDWGDHSDNDDNDNGGGWRRGGGGGGWRRGGGSSSCRHDQCYGDTPGNRLLRGLSNANDYGWQVGDMTVQKCTEYCMDQGYSIAGLEFSTYCFCGDRFAYQPTYSSGCNMACGGQGGEMCGGANAIDVYRC